MTADETKAVLAVIKVAFPGFSKGIDPDDVLNVWHDMFRDDDMKVVAEAVKILIATSKFPPTIAEVREKVMLVTRPQTDALMTELDAWNIVDKAIDYYRAGENFMALPPLLKRLVGSPNRLKEWSCMDADVVNSVVASNFMRSYAAIMRREKEISMLPESTRAMIRNSENKLTLDFGKEQRDEAN
jgi:hypothetical protein